MNEPEAFCRDFNNQFYTQTIEIVFSITNSLMDIQEETFLSSIKKNVTNNIQKEDSDIGQYVFKKCQKFKFDCGI